MVTYIEVRLAKSEVATFNRFFGEFAEIRPTQERPVALVCDVLIDEVYAAIGRVRAVWTCPQVISFVNKVEKAIG